MSLESLHWNEPQGKTFFVEFLLIGWGIMHLVGLSVTQGLELVIDLSCTVSFPALPDLMSVYTGTACTRSGHCLVTRRDPVKRIRFF